MALSEQTPLRLSNPVSSGTFALSEGLSSSEAADRLLADGPNKLEVSEEEPFFSILLTQMKSTIFLLTTMAAAVSHLLGEHAKPYLLIGLVVFVCLAKAWGEYSGQDAGKALASMTAAKAVVIRDGQELTKDQEELVVGDVVKLQMGDVVPADMVVLDSIDLQANEALLTGEPHEQRKTVEPIGKNSTFPSNLLYKGTSIVGGQGKGEVMATGMKTQVGLIAKRLKAEEIQELSPLQESINMIGTLIGMFCVLVVFLATSVAYATKFNDPSHPCLEETGDCLLLSSIERGLMMAVSIIPHGLPFVVMVMLRVGAGEMKARNALLTRQSAVDYIGATTVICTDKTGTLTEGKMTAKRLLGLCASDDTRSDESSLSFYPLRGLSPNGGLFLHNDLKPAAMLRMDGIYDYRSTRQSFAEEGLPDFGDASAVREGLHGQLARAHLACGYLTCYGASVREGEVPGQWETKGNMTETAVKVAAAKGGYWDGKGLGADLLAAFPRDEELEVPFTSMRKMMVTVHHLSKEESNERCLESLQVPKDSTHLAILKGAPDRLTKKLRQIPLKHAENIMIPGRPLSETDRDLLGKWNSDLANEALRSLLVAVCTLSGSAAEKMRSLPDADMRLSFLLDHPDLCFLSLWGIYDPPRAMVPGSVEDCHRAGVRVVMITGDQHATAVAVGKQVGILLESESDSHNASECLQLQVGTPLKPDTKRLSKRASQLIASGDLVTQQKRSSGDLGKKPATALDAPKHEGSRRLSIHDQRNCKDDHEPTYKTEEELAALTSRVNVWARAQPTDKVAIVESLSKQDHITVMTGDGVNDAPALKHANTGVAMGISGTEVAKNAASLVLMDDDFSTIVAAVREGRRIYANTQKYLLYNFCLKEGELCCVLFAILFRMPVPIQGVPQLINLMATHMLAPLCLSIEKPEAYLMKIPPRKTRFDFIVTPLMMFHRWIPYLIFMSVGVLSCMGCGLWLQTGFITSAALIGTSRYGELDRGLVACEYAGNVDANGHFVSDPAPFHCKCHNRWDQVDVDQWGSASHSEQELLSKFDPWSGHAGSFYTRDASDWKQGVDQFLTPCFDGQQVQRWCWKDNKRQPTGRPLLSASHNCAAYGSRLGQTMGYASIQLSEILTLMNFRTDDCIFMHLHTNVLYIAALICNLGVFYVLLYVPRVAEALQFAPLSAGRLALALSFPIVFVLFNEGVKLLYMKKLRVEHAALNAETAPTYSLDAKGSSIGEGEADSLDEPASLV